MKIKSSIVKHALWLVVFLFVLLSQVQFAFSSVKYEWFLTAPHNTRNVVFSLDDKSILVGSDEGLHIINAADGTVMKKLIDSGFYNAFYSKEGNTIIAFGKRVAILDTSDLHVIREFENDSLTFTFGELSTDGTKLLLSEKAYPTFRIWDISTGKITKTYFLGMKYINDSYITEIRNTYARYSFDGTKIYVNGGGSYKQNMKPYEIINSFGFFKIFNSENYDLLYSDSVTYNKTTQEGEAALLVGTKYDQIIQDHYTHKPENHSIQITDLKTMQIIKAFNLPLDIDHLEYTPDGKHWVIATSYSGRYIYNLEKMEIIDTLSTLGGTPFKISNEYKEFVVYGDNIALFKYDFLNFTEIREFETNNILFPNPTTNSLTIKFSIEKSANLKTSLFDSYGRNIKDYGSSYYELGENQINLDLSFIQNGTYFIKIEGENYSKIFKIIKMK